ncbi:MAG: D-2-hydroxyacid dehydrogenase [Gemmatimonadetes bacterium]|nr:D-2-hydroxyacid dehydrogenase [Gemmatimonadota bacterium]MDE3257012.1 D-2-hydroxyacid dehydrogenase [Gemmatimonadota bacterium]
MKIVLCPPVSDALCEQVRRTVPGAEVVTASMDVAPAVVGDADVIFGMYNEEIIAAATQVRWIQTTSAGMDMLMNIPGVREGQFRLSNASGLHALQVAEHAWALTAALFRGLHVYIRNQLACKWKGAPIQDLYGATAGIVGFGGIGRRYASLARGFDMRVLAVDVQQTERPDHVEALWGPDRLDDLLAASDVVFIACPYTPETERLINAGAFQLMKESAFLVNTARGPIVDETALVDALMSAEIAGAGLDVFETEPLPDTSPLWEMENVIITTHSAGVSSYRPQRTVDFFCENLRRFVAGEPLLNETDRNLGYPALGRRVE